MILPLLIVYGIAKAEYNRKIKKIDKAHQAICVSLGDFDFNYSVARREFPEFVTAVCACAEKFFVRGELPKTTQCYQDAKQAMMNNHPIGQDGNQRYYSDPLIDGLLILFESELKTRNFSEALITYNKIQELLPYRQILSPNRDAKIFHKLFNSLDDNHPSKSHRDGSWTILYNQILTNARTFVDNNSKSRAQ